MRDQIIQDEQFSSQLEYSSSGWLASSADKNLRRFWIDGFIPETLKNTKRGVEVEGWVWVGEGASIQHQYQFTASVPQKMLHGQRQGFDIESILLDEQKQLIELRINSRKPIAG